MHRVLATLFFAALIVCVPWAQHAYAAPIIQLESEGTNGSGQFFAEFRIEDAAGLDEVFISTISNLIIAPLQPGLNQFAGTATSVLLTATTIDQTQLGLLGLQATNVAGAVTVFEARLDPVNNTVTTASVPEPATVFLLATALVATRRRAARQGRFDRRLR